MWGAIDRIDTLEPLPRGTYCGTVGWVDADRRQADLNVAIRTFWAEGGMLHLGTGGAITYDSTPEDEWNETELKAHRLLAVAATPTTPNRSSPDRSGSTASWSPPKRPPSPSPTTV
jgi:anthranilate/para-aminobenzoate synthase component I